MWPSAELHVHIEGTLEVPLLLRLAERNAVELVSSDPEVLQRRYAFDSLQSFLDLYYENLAVLRTEQDFYELCSAYLERAARAGVRHAEIFFDPQSHTERGVPLGTVVFGLSRAIGEAQERWGMTASLILCLLRHLGGEAASDMIRAALPFRRHFVGVGLDSSELGFPPSLFQEAFAIAAAEGLHRVAHAGEEGGPDYVWEALDLLGVERVDHGNRALEDAELMAVLRERRIPLTVCPLSNLALKTAPDELADHALPVMLDEGLLASVHSDDPAYFGGYLDDNIAALRAAGVLTEEQFGVLAANSIVSSFASAERKAELLAEVRAHALALGVAVPAAARRGAAE
ncbi:adenosine deaminase [Mycetocola reblochoni]|uniref:Adenine deaminase n=1 Tax=Mycetocola reblochoni REB411 TaxID=1255698 RepID=A0A1R4JJD9_9MICO|nr:adenosine deaminase [Mycetocola reblochoni]SJN32381.1 Adenosine deaminase [Mycetocola reblochoni REB411]